MKNSEIDTYEILKDITSTINSYFSETDIILIVQQTLNSSNFIINIPFLSKFAVANNDKITLYQNPNEYYNHPYKLPMQSYNVPISDKLIATLDNNLTYPLYAEFVDYIIKICNSMIEHGVNCIDLYLRDKIYTSYNPSDYVTYMNYTFGIVGWII